jgi:Holliday junction resolvase-like predicted endonuclease
VSEQLKAQYNRGQRPSVYFWRDHSGHEIDLIMERGSEITAVEIKSGATLHPSFFDGLSWFAKQTGLPATRCALVYGGDQRQNRTAGQVYPWFDAVI